MAIVALLGAPSAAAHTVLVASDPAAGAQLTAAPTVVTLTFNEPVAALGAQITVVDSTGNQWPTGEAAVANTTVSTTVGALGTAGDYAVNYRVVAADGHVATGTIGFAVTAEGQGLPVAASGQVGYAIDPTALVIGGIAIVAAAALVWALARRRRAR